MAGRVIRVFICPLCKYRALAPKRADKRTPRGHVKTMYCPMCKRNRRFIQISK